MLIQLFRQNLPTQFSLNRRHIRLQLPHLMVKRHVGEIPARTQHLTKLQKVGPSSSNANRNRTAIGSARTFRSSPLNARPTIPESASHAFRLSVLVERVVLDTLP
jgi:hypothetical protein